MSTSNEQSALVLELAEEFLNLYRNGHRPSLQQYIDRHPDLAAEIREVFPAMALMEQVAIQDGTFSSRPNSSPPPSEPASPTLIGDYRIIREVGRGGMGIVYEAEQVSLGRHVALKILPKHAMADSRQKRRFEREAKAAARLHHTNIVPIFGVGDHDGLPYYVMQFIQGLGLDQVLEELRRLRLNEPDTSTDPTKSIVREVSAANVARSLATGVFQPPEPDSGGSGKQSGSRTEPKSDSNIHDHSSATLSLTATTAKLPGHQSAKGKKPTYWQSVAHIGVQVARALDHAHKQGILHRDIKPSNLLLDLRGTVWVTDFGLAKADDQQNLTHTGDILGTLRYMPPEAFDGRTDARGDLYSLGITLFEMLAMRPAFSERDRNKLIKSVTTDDVPRLDRLNPEVPRDLVTIVHKAVDRDPGRRYASAADLAADLQRFLDDEPIQARRISAGERIGRWCRRNPAMATLTTAVLVLLLAVALVSTISSLQLSAALTETNKAKAEALDKLWGSYLSQAEARWMSRRPGQRFGSRRAIEEALKLPLPARHSLDELRTEAIASMLLPDVEVIKEWDRLPTGASGFALDKSFERYAFGDRNGNISVRRVRDDHELFSIPGSGEVNGYGGLQFSPDGQFLHVIYSAGGKYHGRIWRLSERDGLKSVFHDDHCGFSWRADAKQFAVVYPTGLVRVCEATTFHEVHAFTNAGLNEPIYQVAWSPDGAHLLLRGAFALRNIEVASGAVKMIGLKIAEGFSWAQWRPDGRMLAVCGEDRRIYLWDTVNQRLAMPPLEGHRNFGVVCCFNHAGDRLLSTDWSGICRLWDPRSGQLLLSYVSAGPLQFSADDQLAGADISVPHIRLFRLRSGSEYQTLTCRQSNGHGGFIQWYPTTLNRDGRLLAAPTREAIVLIDLVRGEEVATLPRPNNAPFAFEPDGSLLTSGQDGLLRWPAKQTGDNHILFGRPERIMHTPKVMHSYSASADGQVVAIPDGNSGAIVYHRDADYRIRLGPQDDVRNCAVSPDGKWVATGTFSLPQGSAAKVWDAVTGKQLADLPVLGLCGVSFSPNGRWLLTTGGGCRIWHTGTWTEGPKLGASGKNPFGAFSPDSSMLALGDLPGIIRLVSTEGGREIARLSILEQVQLAPYCFTPDGGKLIAVGVESESIHVFDLRAIRRQLAEIGLDWDAPALPPDAASAHEPLQVETVSGQDLQRWFAADGLVKNADQQWAMHHYKEVQQTLRNAVQADPNNARANNALAWFLLTGPNEFREPKEALRLARKAVELIPGRPLFQNTLGVALYRNNQLHEATSVLEKNLQESKGTYDAFDLYFLAMCYHRLGERAKGLAYLTRAIQWRLAHNSSIPGRWREELTAFRVEATEVLAKPPDHSN